MNQYLSPGVYVEEKSSGVKPIEGVGTSTGAFVGITEKGPIGKAELIANWTQFVSKFGGYIANGNTAYAVNQFFNEGGTRCYVVRTCHYMDIQDLNTKASSPSAGTLIDSNNESALRVLASSDGKWGDKISIDVKAATGPELEKNGFKLIVKYNDIEVEAIDDLTIDNVEDTIKNNDLSYIRVEKDDWDEGSPPNNVAGSGNNPLIDQSITLEEGDDGINDLNSTDFTGDGSAQNGLYAFDVIDDINIVDALAVIVLRNGQLPGPGPTVVCGRLRHPGVALVHADAQNDVVDPRRVARCHVHRHGLPRNRVRRLMINSC